MLMNPRSLSLLVSAVLLLSACASQSAAPAEQASSSAAPSTSATSLCEALPADPGWHGDNHARLSAMIKKLGECGGSGDVTKGAPLALFDWDNTVVKNDIGDATTFWMLANGRVLQPTDWAKVSTFMTPAAAQALTAACGSLTEPGQPLPTNTEGGTSCADEILSVYSDGATTGGAEAFTGFNHRRIEPQYAFAAQLLSGYTEDEVKAFAAQARDQNLKAAEGAKQKVGSKEVTGWIRYYEQVTGLIKTLKGNGFDVRIVSASAEPVVRAWAEPLGLSGDRVMGVTQVLNGDKLTGRLTSCGGDPEAMTYIEGKRCRVNEQIYGLTGPEAFLPAPEKQRPAFGAGDSDTDISFMIDATELRLVINRNKTELMCNAYDDEDGKWIINPMFIKPLQQKEEPYPCSTGGEILADGRTGPLKDSNGNLVADQKDTVFG